MVVAAVQAEEADVAELGAPGAALSAPGGVEVPRQGVADRCIIDAQHEVMPGEVVIAEIYPPQIGRIIRDDELLVVSKSEAHQKRTCGVGHPDPHAGLTHGVEHAARRPKLRAEIGIEECMRRVDEAVADDEARVVVHQDPAIDRVAGHGGPPDRKTGLVAFEGHGLDQHAPARLRHVGPSLRQEGVRSDQKGIFRQEPLRPVAILACAVAQGAGAPLEAAHA